MLKTLFVAASLTGANALQLRGPGGPSLTGGPGGPALTTTSSASSADTTQASGSEISAATTGGTYIKGVEHDTMENMPGNAAGTDMTEGDAANAGAASGQGTAGDATPHMPAATDYGTDSDPLGFREESGKQAEAAAAAAAAQAAAQQQAAQEQADSERQAAEMAAAEAAAAAAAAADTSVPGTNDVATNADHFDHGKNADATETHMPPVDPNMMGASGPGDNAVNDPNMMGASGPGDNAVTSGQATTTGTDGGGPCPATSPIQCADKSCAIAAADCVDMAQDYPHDPCDLDGMTEQDKEDCYKTSGEQTVGEDGRDGSETEAEDPAKFEEEDVEPEPLCGTFTCGETHTDACPPCEGMEDNDDKDAAELAEPVEQYDEEKEHNYQHVLTHLDEINQHLFDMKNDHKEHRDQMKKDQANNEQEIKGHQEDQESEMTQNLQRVKEEIKRMKEEHKVHLAEIKADHKEQFDLVMKEQNTHRNEVENNKKQVKAEIERLKDELGH